jgi:excinuclease ABC subunit C
MTKHLQQDSIDVSTQHELLAEQVKAMPRSAGVYLMKDASSEIIYIGKAKSLKARLNQYIKGSDERSQIEFLMRRVVKIEIVITDTEEQAFILERDLINKHKPRYNIRLKDDKAYLSIRIDENVEWPRLELVRRVEHDGASYYGPYSFSYEVRELLELINRVVPLRSCTDTVFYNRVRPCLEYQIKRCAGPCCLPVEAADYRHWVKQAKAILEGKTEGLVRELNRMMDLAAQELRFEDAAIYRDRLNMLENFKTGQKYLSVSADDKDVWSLYREESLAVVSLLKFRRGRVANVLNYALEDVRILNSELLQSLLEQYYRSGAEFPHEVILSDAPADLDFTMEHLKELAGQRIEIVMPERGLKFRLLKLAELNAQQHYRANFNSELRSQELAKALAKLCSLQQLPRRVECLDISNLQGSDIVGAIVSFYDGQPDKKNYKRYRIKSSGVPNDFASVYEVVGRRLRRGLQEDSLPDLLVIDGGPGQLSAALKAREEAGSNLDIISIAKERQAQVTAKGAKRNAKQERIYLRPERDAAILLDVDQLAGRFLIQLRDETHRFVIGFHRERRAKRIVSSALDQIKGLGPERRQRLLKHFASTKNIAAASVDEIARVGRMSKALAQKTKDYLRS